jgi:hypothetical protein
MPRKAVTPRPTAATALALLLALATAALAFPAAGLSAPGGSGEPLVVSPPSAAFPATTVGTHSPVQELDVANETGEGVSIGSVSIEGADSPDFGLDFSGPPICGGSLDPGKHCALRIRLSPNSAGEKQATVAIHFSDGRPDQLVALTGTAVPAQLEFAPPSHDFGVHWVNSGADTTLQLTNSGEAGVQVNGVDVLGDSNNFGTGSSDCWGRWLQPGETCSVQVWFNPRDVVAYSAQLRASVNGASFTAELSGAGGRAVLEPSSNPASFGSASAGTAGSIRTISLTNTGNLPGTFFIAVIAGGDAGSFQLLDESCTAAPVMPSASCTAHVRFDPQGAGVKSARLALFGDGDGGGTMVVLTGVGVAPSMTLGPASLDFGKRVVGSRNAGHYFTVRNAGHAPLELYGAFMAGSDLDQFALAGDGCTGNVLGVGEECLLRVRFTPDSPGAKTATLRIASDAGSLSAALTGVAFARRAATSRASSHHPRRLRHRFRHGSGLGIARARCRAHRCRAAVSSHLGVEGD